MASLSEEHLEKSQATTDPNERLHELRKSIDALIQWSNELKLNSGKSDGTGYGREISLVHTKLQEAKMWVGKCLEVTGNPLPAEFADKA